MKNLVCLLIAVLFHVSTHAQQVYTLKQCVEEAWANNLDIQQGTLTTRISQIDLDQIRLSMLPSLNAGATHGYNWGQTIDPFTNQFATDRVRNNNFFLQSSVTLFQGFQLQNSIKQSRSDLLASEQDLEELRNNIGLFVAQSYLNIALNKEQIRSSQAQLNASTLQVERMQRMVDVGQEAQASLNQLKAQQAADKFQLTQAENALSISKLALSNVMMLSPDAAAVYDIADISIDADALSDPPPVMLIYQTALESLPQVKAAMHREESSQVGLAIAQGSRYPLISLTGSLGSGYSGANQLPSGEPDVELVEIGFVEGTNDAVLVPNLSYDQFDTKSFSDQLDDNFNQSLSLQLTVPLFNNYQVSTSIKKAKIGQQIATINAQSVKNQLMQDIQQAHADAVAAKRSYEAAMENYRANELSFSNTESRFEQEMVSTLDYNVAKSQLAIAETSLSRAQYDYLFRMTIIDFYMGNELKID